MKKKLAEMTPTQILNIISQFQAEQHLFTFAEYVQQLSRKQLYFPWSRIWIMIFSYFLHVLRHFLEEARIGFYENSWGQMKNKMIF